MLAPAERIEAREEAVSEMRREGIISPREERERLARARLPGPLSDMAENIEDHGDVITFDMRRPTPAEVAARTRRLAIEQAEWAIGYNEQMAAALRNPAAPSPWDVLPNGAVYRERDATMHDARAERARDNFRRLTKRSA